MEKKKISILGAGGAGACAALELSQRGYSVDLYEEGPTPIRKASYVNEGKIHLGFIYAMDHDLHTAKQMILGSLHFISNLKRWIDIKPEDLISTPFNYCVHRGSLMSPDELASHYHECIKIFNTYKAEYKKSYLDLFDSIEANLLTKKEADKIVNSEFIEAVFSTSEYAVEPRAIAKQLTEALYANPSINLILNTKVTSVERSGSGLTVKGNSKGVQIEEKYPIVINATWNGLLEIDKSMGVELPKAWSYRYKYGNKILIPITPDNLPSCTMVQGPFGDTVNFKEKGAFISWYPIGRAGWSEECRPPEWDSMFSDTERHNIFNSSFKELTKRVPALGNLAFNPNNVSPVGGVIYALGNTDVDKHDSKLHTRSDVGIRSYGNYHSLHTGKYTLIPYWAVKIADRIEGLS